MKNHHQIQFCNHLALCCDSKVNNFIGNTFLFDNVLTENQIFKINKDDNNGLAGHSSTCSQFTYETTNL